MQQLIGLVAIQIASAAAMPRLAQYELDVALSPEAKKISVKGTVTLPPEPQKRDRIEFELSQQMRTPAVELIDPVESAGRVAVSLVAKHEDTARWKLTLPRKVPAGAPLTLRFSYGGTVKPAFQFVLHPKSSFAFGGASAWYPQLPDSRGNGLGLLRFSVPPGQVVIASGERQSTPDQEQAGHFAFSLRHRAALSFAAGKYRVVRRGGLIPVSALVYQPRPEFDVYLNGCSKVLELLVSWNGPYPYGEFAVVEVPDEIARSGGFYGASFPGFILGASSSLRRPFNLAYFAHEIGHQWWGNEIVVSGDEGRYLLSEALTQFGALEVIQALEGTKSAALFRRSGYPGYSDLQCGVGYLTIATAGFDHRLVDLPRGQAASHALANSKGFLAWHALSRTIGPEKFHRALRAVTQDFADTDVTWSDFVERLKASASTDLTAVLEQWFQRTGAPEWQAEWQLEGSSARTVLAQSEPPYALELEIDLIGDEGQRVTRSVSINQTRTGLELVAPFPVRRVEVDPRYEVLHSTPALRAEASALAPAYRAGNLQDAGKSAAAISEYRRALERLPSPDLYGAGFALEYGWARALASQHRWKEARAHWLSALQRPTRRPAQLPWAYLRLAEIAKREGDLRAWRRATEAAVSAEAVEVNEIQAAATEG